MATGIIRVISVRHLFILLVPLSLLVACGQNGPSSTGTNTAATPTPALDVYGTPIVFPKTAPQRIVSLIPSISEILGALPLQSRIVGVDYDTNYPGTLSSLPKVSDASGVYNVERIVALKPDLVLSYGADTKQYDTQLKQLGLHVVDLAALDVSQTIQEIRLVGRLTFTQTAADALAQDMQRQVDHIRAAVAETAHPSVLLEVDDSSPGKPYVFGGTSFGDELAQDANARNIFHDNTSNGGFPQVTDEAVIKANPQYIILTENAAYGGNVNLVYKRANWGSIDAVKAHRVYHINTDIMQRPGPRLVQGLQCLAQILHPDKFPGALPAYCSASV
ncbi:MAG: ABC transporter substrate-binding protein [Ktedonobacteraceae bacterium]|nr:ABC transporter substrate-binding protein [Ktedonobacteraceae bacterium]